MDNLKLFKKIQEETRDETISTNYAKALSDVTSDFEFAIEAWLEGREEEFFFQGVSLSMIRKKEHCSHLQALLTMQTLMTHPSLAARYEKWQPINKDRGR